MNQKIKCIRLAHLSSEWLYYFHCFNLSSTPSIVTATGPMHVCATFRLRTKPVKTQMCTARWGSSAVYCEKCNYNFSRLHKFTALSFMSRLCTPSIHAPAQFTTNFKCWNWIRFEMAPLALLRYDQPKAEEPSWTNWSLWRLPLLLCYQNAIHALTCWQSSSLKNQWAKELNKTRATLNTTTHIYTYAVQ